MQQIFTYYSRYQSLRGGLNTLPAWGRALVLLAALPGIVLLALSFLALGVSILALLVLTVPVYRFVSAVAGNRAPAATQVTTVEGVQVETPMETVFDPLGTSPKPRRQVDVRIVEE